jgi:hypothetical protein
MTRFRPRSKYDLSLLAPPCNPELSTEPNKSQTIVNVVRAEGPMKRLQLFARMQELLGPERATYGKIAALMHQLLMGRPPRIHHDYETDTLSSVVARAEVAS